MLKIKNIIKRVVKCILVVLLGAVILQMGLFVIMIYASLPSPPDSVVVTKHLFGKNAAYIVSKEGKRYQLQENGQSYLTNTEYIYTYGPKRFIYVNQHTGDVYIVLSEDIDRETEAKLKKHLHRVNKNEADSPRFIFLDESQLDKNTYMIMKFLENDTTPYPNSFRLR